MAEMVRRAASKGPMARRCLAIIAFLTATSFFGPGFRSSRAGGMQVTLGRQPETATRAVFEVPQVKLPPPADLADIYPSADRLPENLLRIYLQFTGPMRRGDVYEYVRLLGPDGKAVETPFVTFGEELWNADGTRLTLLLDPGRQKHDLLPRQQAGPVLEAGKEYTLVINGDWPDAYGRPLGPRHSQAVHGDRSRAAADSAGRLETDRPAAGSASRWS